MSKALPGRAVYVYNFTCAKGQKKKITSFGQPECVTVSGGRYLDEASL